MHSVGSFCLRISMGCLLHCVEMAKVGHESRLWPNTGDARAVALSVLLTFCAAVCKLFSCAAVCKFLRVSTKMPMSKDTHGLRYHDVAFGSTNKIWLPHVPLKDAQHENNLAKNNSFIQYVVDADNQNRRLSCKHPLIFLPSLLVSNHIWDKDAWV